MLHQIQKWTIRTIKEFNPYGGVAKSKWVLYKDETTPVVELDITELRKLKDFFDDWKDPFHKDNPDHHDNLK